MGNADGFGEMKALPDGMLISSADGRVCRVFAPSAWAPWRWIAWLLLPRDRKIVEERAGFKARLVVEAERAS